MAVSTNSLTFSNLKTLHLPKQKVLMDSLLSEYIEHLWGSGEGRAVASDTVAGLQDLEPHLKGSPPTVWILLKVWSQNELPNRAPPIPRRSPCLLLLAALYSTMIMLLHAFALSVSSGFYGIMRTGELLALSSQDLEVQSLNSPAVISLGMTKSGKRQGASESITVSVFDVVRRLQQWKMPRWLPISTL